MRVFQHPNMGADWKCPVCKTNEDKPIVLLGIEGTQEGHNMEAEQFHLDCIDPLYYKDRNILTQVL